MPKMLRDKRILWGSIFMVCITLGLLLIQPGSVMLAESSRQVVQPLVPSSISLKRLQSSSTYTAQNAVGVSSAPYSNDAISPSLAATPESTATPLPVYIIPSATSVLITPTPSPMPTVDVSPTPLPASPTPSLPPSVTPTAIASPTLPSSATPTVIAKPTVLPTHNP